MVWWIDSKHQIWSWTPGQDPKLEHPDVGELLQIAHLAETQSIGPSVEAIQNVSTSSLHQ
jgi:hypothetical protein